MKSMQSSLAPPYLALLCCVLVAVSCQAPDKKETQEQVWAKMLARAVDADLKNEYTGPPGDALTHHTAGFAKIMCSAVFITGLKPEFAAENLGYFVAPYEERSKVSMPIIDFEEKSVTITLPSGLSRKAIYVGSQGCVTLPLGVDSLFYKPVEVARHLPDASSTAWPMGDVLSTEPMPDELDMEKVNQAVDAAFETEDAMTAAFVVTYKGRLIAERYQEGITKDTPLESWSMGKSLTSTMMGILINQGVYSLEQPAPIPQWQAEGDERSKIRIMDILRMSSGIRCRAPQDPDYDPALGYPDHLYLYTGGVNSFEWAANRPQQWPPNTIGRYRNIDPVLTNYLVRLGVENKGGEYLTFPQRELFDKIGIRTMVMETDPYGNFLFFGLQKVEKRIDVSKPNCFLHTRWRC